MLKELVGRCHTVHTGVVIKYQESVTKFTESTKVYFGRATDEQIQAYVDTKEPLDKAGGYGIQGYGGMLIEKIDGDYFTVMGLPLYRLCVEICKKLNYEIPEK
jgi:septum formation protein